MKKFLRLEILDNLFPADYFTFFGLSDANADSRRDSLNLFMVALCGCESIMSEYVVILLLC
jgi:hypothetical protein